MSPGSKIYSVISRDTQEKPYVCRKCQKRYKRESSLKEHFASVHEGKRFECEKCHVKFTLPSGLRAHKSRSHQIQCDMCSETACNMSLLDTHKIVAHTHSNATSSAKSSISTIYNSETNSRPKNYPGLKAHSPIMSPGSKIYSVISRDTQEKPYVCRKCQKRYKRESSLKEHFASVHEGKRFECEKCHVKFTLPSGLRAHKSRAHQCDMCSETACTASLLETHKVVAHTQSNVSVSIICESNTHSTSSEKNIHSDQPDVVSKTREKLFPCDLCLKVYKSEPALQKHVESFHNGKRFTCDVCNTSLTHESSLSRHKSLHKCEICAAHFCQKWRYDQHIMLSHPVNSVLSCRICRTTFKSKSRFSIHLQTHASKLPYKCDFCSKRFKSHTNLTTHTLNCNRLSPGITRKST
eukprot:709410_1